MDPNSVMNDLMIPIMILKNQFFQFIPQLLHGLIVFGVGVLLAFVFKWLATFGTGLIGKALPLQVTRKNAFGEDWPALSRSVGRLTFYTTLFLALTVALHRMGFAIISKWLENLAQHLPNIAVSLLIVFLGLKLKKFLSQFLYKTFSRTAPSQAKITSTIISWTVFGISVVVAMEQVGLKSDFIITIFSILLGFTAGAVALTFARGATASVSDILCCYQVHRYMKVGQKIEVSGQNGVIDSIGPAFVVLKTEKGKIMIPGSLFSREASLVYEREEL